VRQWSCSLLYGLGSALGIVGAIGVAQVAQMLLFRVERLDASTIAVVCTLLTATGFVALYLPALWASRVEPAQALRDE
jgi:putative ABC transport system permease protein